MRRSEPQYPPTIRNQHFGGSAAAGGRIEGWLFDIDELGPWVTLWVYDDDGRLRRLTDEFRPPVYAHGDRAKLKQLAADMSKRDLIAGLRWVQKREFWSGDEIEVLQLNVSDSSHLSKLREIAAKLDRDITFYNLDIPTPQHYLYLTKLFPLCRVKGRVDERGAVIEIAATNSAWELDHPMPPLRVMRMRGERMRPLTAASRLIIATENDETVLHPAVGAKAISTFNEIIERYDPDLILSERGDSVLFPALLQVAGREKLRLPLDRDHVITERKIETEGRTYFSYGNIIYKPPSYPLFGRWHIDRESSFAHHETGLEGLLEMSRLSRLPVQRAARRSPGTSMTSMQMDRAINDGILIPWRKNEPEKAKTALQLLRVDKGGLTFQPKIGEYENVAEIDFASMYPSLMIKRNISPETVLCSCCPNIAVPEAGYNICEKRRGLIPLTLEPLVERRKAYKQMMKSADERTRAIYVARRAAMKWMLVTCFGYMGYKNARMGRIEAHEAVTAWGRETLLRAKEIAEGAGFDLLHALTDSLWIEKEGVTEEELTRLCETITCETGIEMSLEGVYRWLVFAPSKVKSTRPVAARFYGVFTDGGMKIRGLACRRHDTPQFIKEAQEEMLAELSKARNIEELRRRRQDARRVYEARLAQIESGRVDPRLLIIEQVLSREVEKYDVETRAALAARELGADGVKVHPGEKIGYVITNAKAKNKADRVAISNRNGLVQYDRREYAARLKVAAKEVGVICDDDSSDEQGGDGANRLPLFPD
ncbi:MAG TPA: DNA polymerase domain-containing protein [Blastocatellia bacterium]|nr:DNA polymerase domain-containing protein [Blastocatellia bacterium]